MYEFADVVRTIEDHIDSFENIGVLLKEKNGHLNTPSHGDNFTNHLG